MVVGTLSTIEAMRYGTRGCSTARSMAYRLLTVVCREIAPTSRGTERIRGLEAKEKDEAPLRVKRVEIFRV